MKTYAFVVVCCLVSWGMATTGFAAPPVAHLTSLPQATLIPVQVSPGSRVNLGGRPVPVTPDGLALLAVGQFDAGSVSLRITSPEGQKTTRTLAITPRRWQVQRITGLPQGMVSPPAAVQKRIDAENALLARLRLRNSPQAWFRRGFQAPATGRISGIFGSHRILNGQPRNAHRGVDFAGKIGTPVWAAADGVVMLAAPDMVLTGQTVLIDHGYTLSTVYVHMSETLIREGDHVTKGQLIGRIGATGRATGPHLHWGATVGSVHIDPLTLLAADFGG
jgi:murein DD-endopeptidase MepM/ murein hydrolase activator NlpD